MVGKETELLTPTVDNLISIFLELLTMTTIMKRFSVPCATVDTQPFTVFTFFFLLPISAKSSDGQTNRFSEQYFCLTESNLHAWVKI